MKSIVEYIQNNDEIMYLISEVLDSKEISNIEESFLFENSEDNIDKKYYPKNYDELQDVFDIKDAKNTDDFNGGWIKFCKKYIKNFISTYPYLILDDNTFNTYNAYKNLQSSILLGNMIIQVRTDKLVLDTKYQPKDHTTLGSHRYTIDYDYSHSVFYNIIALLEKNDMIYNQFFQEDSSNVRDKFTTDYDEYKKLNLKKIEKIDLSKINDQENSESNSSSDEVKDTVTDSIKANKDLLTPLAKEANITGEKLRDIITKVCLDKNGKARKLDDSVILGLSIMLCGVILTVKKSGKSDNSAILAVTNKIASIVKNKKSIKNTI